MGMVAMEVKGMPWLLVVDSAVCLEVLQVMRERHWESEFRVREEEVRDASCVVR